MRCYDAFGDAMHPNKRAVIDAVTVMRDYTPKMTSRIIADRQDSCQWVRIWDAVAQAAVDDLLASWGQTTTTHADPEFA